MCACACVCVHSTCVCVCVCVYVCVCVNQAPGGTDDTSHIDAIPRLAAPGPRGVGRPHFVTQGLVPAPVPGTVSVFPRSAVAAIFSRDAVVLGQQRCRPCFSRAGTRRRRSAFDPDFSHLAIFPSCACARARTHTHTHTHTHTLTHSRACMHTHAHTISST